VSNYKWIPIDGNQARAIREALGELLVNGYGQLTDLTGQYGSPQIMDTWGIKGADQPLLRAVTLLGGERDSMGCYFERLETKWHIAAHMDPEE
jgi:hypothetical protein